MNGIEILDLDTGENLIDSKNVMVKEMKIQLGARGVEAEVKFYLVKGGSIVEFDEHYGIGEVELGDWDLNQQQYSKRRGRALQNVQLSGIAAVKDPVDPNCVIIDDPVKPDNRHPDAKLPCPECKDKGYVDLATSREPCNLCKGRTTAVDFAKGGIVSSTVFHTKDLAGEILMPRVDPEKKLGVLGPPAEFLNDPPRFLNEGEDPDDPDLAYFSTEGEARGAAMQALCSREELQGIDRNEIFNVVEDWVADLMHCEDRQEFEDFCCDMSGEVLGVIEEQMEPVNAVEHINCRCTTAPFDNVGPRFGGFGFASWNDGDSDPLEDIESAKKMIEEDVGFRKDPLPTDVLAEVARSIIRECTKKALDEMIAKVPIGVAMEAAPAGEPVTISLDSLTMGEGRSSEVIENKKVSVFDYCILCGRNTKNDHRRCDSCFEKMEQQVMNLARDQIRKNLVKAGDTVKINFDPGDVEIRATIMLRRDGTLHAELDRVVQESIKKEMARRTEISYGATPAGTAPVPVVEAETCDECFGSGFENGIGMPCSKGCKPKK